MTEQKPGKASTREALAATTAMIRRKKIRTPLRLFNTYRGEFVEAFLNADGTVRMGDQTFTSVSTAAAAARVKVAGEFAGRKYPQTNGWTFWHFVDDAGARQLLDSLRK